MLLYAIIAALIAGILTGCVVGWYIVDRDYARAAQRRQAGECLEALRAMTNTANLPAAISVRRTSSGTLYDWQVHE